MSKAEADFGRSAIPRSSNGWRELWLKEDWRAAWLDRYLSADSGCADFTPVPVPVRAADAAAK